MTKDLVLINWHTCIIFKKIVHNGLDFNVYLQHVSDDNI